MNTLARIIADFDPAQAYAPPASWLQGRTAYGGLSAALALQAALREPPGDLPPLRSAHVSFIGPAAGPMRFQVQRLRQGKSATSVAVDGYAGEALFLRVAFLFARPRNSVIRHDFSRPMSVPAPDVCRPLPHSELAPVFLGNFDVRPAGGALPVSGSDNPEFMAWVRHKDAQGVDPAVALIALADCLPPAALACLTEMAPVSSMTWTLDLSRPAQPGEWFLLRSASRHAADGYSFQTMEIRDAAGAHVLSGSQTVALFA